MLKIAVCDDDNSVHECMDVILDKYSVNKNTEIEIFHFYGAMQLLDTGEELQVLFLDVEMPGMDGIEAAEIWNRREHDCKIVVLTSHRERVKEFFKIGALRFVTKPIDQEEVFEALDEVQNRILGQEQVTLGKNGREYTFCQKEILYCMAEKNIVHICTLMDVFRSKYTLREWADILDEGLFFQCHKSYIVNLAEIKKLKRRS